MVGDLVVDRHHSNVEVIDRKRAMQGDGVGGEHRPGSSHLLFQPLHLTQ